MEPRSAFYKWAVLGVVTASLFTWGQAAVTGGLTGLLQVGETSDLRPLIEGQLGEVALAEGPGHDGQISYAIGLDLDGDEVGPLLDHAAYRYRRVLYPLLASGLGLLDGRALLWGLVVMSVISVGVAAGVVAMFAARAGRSDWLALVVILNPGVWLSVRLLTSDSLALALMVVGLWYVSPGAGRSMSSFALSALAKDVYLATPLGLGISSDRRRWLVAAIPAGVLIGWMAWLTMRFGEGFSGRGNLALPLTGIADGAANWASLDFEEWLYLTFALLSVATGLLAGITRRTWLRWPILAWSALALVSSNWVWDFGNNAARAYAPIVVLLALAWVAPGRQPAQTATAGSTLEPERGDDPR